MVLDADGLLDAVDRVVAESGELDGVACFAGSMLLLDRAHLTTREQYDGVIAASLTTAFATVARPTKTCVGAGRSSLVSSAAAMAGLSDYDGP